MADFKLDILAQGPSLGPILQESRVAADLIKKVTVFPLSSPNKKGQRFCFEGISFDYMFLSF